MLVKETALEGLSIFVKGKVRDVYQMDNALLFIATDRLSAFDVVMNEPIPHKGIVLNKISLFWFELVEDIVPNHVITAEVKKYPEFLQRNRELLEGRSMLVSKLKMLPFEFVIRGYIAGSGWKDYKETGSISGISLPPGLKFAQKLHEPIFTPATKAVSGHDMNVGEEYLKNKLGVELTSKLKDISISLYEKAAHYGEQMGILIADTKFEFGLKDGEIVICDELLTPDSSRFWIKKNYAEGIIPDSLDKQPVRDYLSNLGWDKNPPPPPLPPHIVHETSQRYLQIYKIITGKDLSNS